MHIVSDQLEEFVETLSSDQKSLIVESLGDISEVDRARLAKCLAPAVTYAPDTGEVSPVLTPPVAAKPEKPLTRW